MNIFSSSTYAHIGSDVELANASEGRPPKDSTVLPLRPPKKTVRLADLWIGWRFGASLGGCFAYLALILNIALTGWASHQSAKGGGHIFQGDCTTADRLNIAIHLVINVLSTLLLGASNYAMQCLCAPTRHEIAVAHHSGRWMDIGVQSFRNLAMISPRRRWIWLALALSSVPLHLFYNSMFYLSVVNRDYDLYFASNAWLQGAPYDSHNLRNGDNSEDLPGWEDSTNRTSVIYNTDPAKIQTAVVQNASDFDALDPNDCINAYSRSFVPDRSNLILLSESMYNDKRIPDTYYEYIATNSSLHWVTPAHDTTYLLFNSDDPYGWICDNWERSPTGCDSAIAKHKAAEGNWTVYGYNVTSCVSQKVKEQCSVNFNLVIGIVIIIVNLGKAACITAVCFTLLDQPIITIGDAIASFLRVPDKTTAGWCLATKDDIRANWAGGKYRDTPPLPQLYTPRYAKRYHAIGKRSWTGFFSLFSASILIILCLLIYALVKLSKYGQSSMSAVWRMGFGVASSSNLISGDGWKLPLNGTGAVLSAILVANSPQALLTGVYLTANNLITRIQLATEWASYVKERKSLRVSHLREGDQRSTYFLQVPYRYGIPLMILSTTLHWLVSQSIFLASVDTWDANGRPNWEESVATCGFSPLAMIFTMIVMAIMAAFAFYVGNKRLYAGMPIVGSCSAGIAAACHPLDSGNEDSGRLMWGEVPQGLLGDGNNGESCDENERVGHCSFSSDRVDVPKRGTLYR